MKILITNDDGINSEGLNALRDSLKGHEVWTASPRPGAKRLFSEYNNKGPCKTSSDRRKTYTCSGTPVDCVVFSINTIMDTNPDMILSGINYGANLGLDLLFSGTAAAARQGALIGIPSIAISQCSFNPPWYFSRGAEFLSRNLEILRKLWRSDHFININIPNIESGPLEARITIPSRTRYMDRVSTCTAPDGDLLCFLSGKRGEGDERVMISEQWTRICFHLSGISFSCKPQGREGYRNTEFKTLP